MSNEKVLKVGIIGCGRIGSLWDENSPAHSPAKTHAKAYSNNAATEIAAVCDLDINRAKATAQKWSVNFFTNEVSEFLKKDLDIISVCTPVENRLPLLKNILEAKPKAALLIEKPLASDLKEATEAAKILSQFECPPVINFSRRFTPGLQKLKLQIEKSQWGTFQSGTAYYGNGFVNNGSHVIDLITFLLGPVNSASAVSKVNDDRTGRDETLSLQLKAAGGLIQIQGLDHRHYTLFELDLHFSKGRIRLTDRAMKLLNYRIIDDPVYDGFKILSEPVVESTDYEKSLEKAVDEVILVKTKKLLKPSCSVEDALAVMSVIENVWSAK